MTPTPSPPSENPVSVWYFIGATFIFAAPTLLFADLAWWARLLFIGVGMVVMALGGLQLRREFAARDRGRAEPEPPSVTPPAE